MARRSSTTRRSWPRPSRLAYRVTRTSGLILVKYPDVTLEQIGHALAYYRAHPEEIAAEFERQERAFDEMERQWEASVMRTS